MVIKSSKYDYMSKKGNKEIKISKVNFRCFLLLNDCYNENNNDNNNDNNNENNIIFYKRNKESLFLNNYNSIKKICF